MCLSKYLKKIENLFFPCSEKLKSAFAQYSATVLDANVRINQKTAQFKRETGLTAYPQFSHLVNDMERKIVRNPW